MKPIIFSSLMIQAILDGIKTQTRRVIKPQPVWVAEPYVPFKTEDADPKGIIKNPFKNATATRQHKLGRHNKNVVAALKNLHEILKDGANIIK